MLACLRDEGNDVVVRDDEKTKSHRFLYDTMCQSLHYAKRTNAYTVKKYFYIDFNILSFFAIFFFAERIPAFFLSSSVQYFIPQSFQLGRLSTATKGGRKKCTHARAGETSSLTFNPIFCRRFFFLLLPKKNSRASNKSL